MNERIGEMLLGHDLPIAIFSYAHGTMTHHASWSPFCAYSPEWLALTEAKKHGAEALFIDLPAWHRAFSEVANRYSDRHSRASSRMQALCERLGIEDVDALWDHLFEQPLEPDDLAARLHTYFRELREGDEAGSRDEQREAYMCEWIAWAMAEAKDRDVVVVCGGYHEPALEDGWSKIEKPARPAIPTLEGDVRLGSYLVPYSFHRLDSFVGYESGMPSPEFYQQVWETGAAAGETMLFQTVKHLRDKKQRVSVADAIAAMTLARGLSTLRGHAALARVDVLDGLAGAVVKDALDAPLPWNRRGVLVKGTEPMLVEMVAAFSGDRTGRLAKGTPRPPLAEDVESELRRVGITPKRTPERIVVPLTEDAGLDRSRVLHRLRVLGIPGFTRDKAQSIKRSERRLDESWTVAAILEAEPAIVEAAMYGATLESAAAAKLEELLRHTTGLRNLAKVLREAAHVGISTLARRVATDTRRAAGIEPDFSALGGALADLLSLYEHDVLLGAAGAPIVGETIEAAFDRGLWLFEAIDGNAGADEVDGAIALRDAVRTVSNKLNLDGARAEAVMHRRAKDANAPPAVRGAALGYLWSTRANVTEAEATTAVKNAGRPDTLGDFLTGLFGLAREEVLHAPTVLEVVDGLVQPMTREDFLIAIPSLRLAFTYFPPQERAMVARKALALHGAAGEDTRTLTTLDVSANVTIAGMKVEEIAKELAARYGLQDAHDRGDA